MEENLSKWDGFLNNLSDEDVKTKLINNCLWKFQ